jgi:hypothetical protein
LLRRWTTAVLVLVDKLAILVPALAVPVIGLVTIRASRGGGERT